MYLGEKEHSCQVGLFIYIRPLMLTMMLLFLSLTSFKQYKIVVEEQSKSNPKQKNLDSINMELNFFALLE